MKVFQHERDYKIVRQVDEPGMHLYADAQDDLMNFIQNLSGKIDNFGKFIFITI